MLALWIMCLFIGLDYSRYSLSTVNYRQYLALCPFKWRSSWLFNVISIVMICKNRSFFESASSSDDQSQFVIWGSPFIHRPLMLLQLLKLNLPLLLLFFSPYFVLFLKDYLFLLIIHVMLFILICCPSAILRFVVCFVIVFDKKKIKLKQINGKNNEEKIALFSIDLYAECVCVCVCVERALCNYNRLS